MAQSPSKDGTSAKRPIRIANCSGANADPGIHMLRQAKYGDCDVITGDYLAEFNLARHAEQFEKGAHPGWEPTALEGLTLSLEISNEKRIKVIINGGALNPKGLAEKTLELINSKKLDLKVGYVSGDDLKPMLVDRIASGSGLGIEHLDSEKAFLSSQHEDFIRDPKRGIVSAHAYLGARAIRKGLEEGADIIICGRVSDASPVIGAAQWWHGWSDTAYDELAGALIGGHLIECSTYVTGANFSGFDKYSIDELMDLALPIAEIDQAGRVVITKADSLRGIVTTDTVICQLLYELQGNIYLHSDVTADITDVQVEQQAEHRVLVHGVKGTPPPPTTKLALFYPGGFQCEFLMNNCGYATTKKWDLYEAQMRHGLKDLDVIKDFDILEFQRCGTPQSNPTSQLASTTYMRMFAQAKTPDPLRQLLKTFLYFGMQHPSGQHASLDMRTIFPIPFNAYYPAIIPQSLLTETFTLLSTSSSPQTSNANHPPSYTPVPPRLSYDPTSPTPLSSFGPTLPLPLGSIVLARSGDKGSNINIGLFVHSSEEYSWLKSFLTISRMKFLMADDWRLDFTLERVEFEGIKAVHFVIYGVLGRGVSSSEKLDCFGKGFADFIRDRVVDVPRVFVEGMEGARM